MHAQNIGTEKSVLKKSEESFDTGIVKKVRKFQHRAKKSYLIEIPCILSILGGCSIGRPGQKCWWVK